MHGLWSIWTTLWSTALSAAVLLPWDSWAWPVMLVTADHSSCRFQHPGTLEKVIRRIWEGSVWASLTLMSREGLNSFQLGFVLHWERRFLLSSSGLHSPFHACLIPFEVKAIRYLTKQIWFSFGVEWIFQIYGFWSHKLLWGKERTGNKNLSSVFSSFFFSNACFSFAEPLFWDKNTTIIQRKKSANTLAPCRVLHCKHLCIVSLLLLQDVHLN